MRDTLTKHGIPDSNLAAAVAYLNDTEEKTLTAFVGEFGLTPSEDDTLKFARFAAMAVLAGAGDVAAVKSYVVKRVTGQPATINAPVIIVAAAPVVDTPEVSIVEVVELDANPEAPVTVKGKGKGKRGRRKNGKSDFCKAVKAIEALPKGSSRQTIIDAIVAEGIKEASASVYAWRYNNGERD